MIELSLSLGEALLDVFRAPLGVLEFLGVVRDEVLDRLVGIAGDDLKAGGRGGQILLLLRLLGDLILQRFGGVDDRGPARPPSCRRASCACRRAPAGSRRGSSASRSSRRSLSRSAVFCARSASKEATFAAKLSEIGGENPLLALAQRRRRRRPASRSPGAGSKRCDRALKSAVLRRRISARAEASSARAPFGVGQGRRAVELDQHVARAARARRCRREWPRPFRFPGARRP